MANVQADLTFEREELPLSEWLLRFVSDNRAKRKAAGKALNAMLIATPSLDVDVNRGWSLDPVEPAVSFQRAIREAAAAPGFDTAEFVRRMCAYSVVMADERRRRVDGNFERRKLDERHWERISERSVAKINRSRDASARHEATSKLARALCAISALEQRNDERTLAHPEALSPASAMAHAVFGSLDIAFLAAPEALQIVLDHPQESQDALAALERIGPPAIAFAPQLLKRNTESAARALGSIVRDNRDFIDRIRKRLHDPRRGARNAAAVALARLGTQVAGQDKEIVGDLLVLLEKEIEYHVVQALASVGRHIPAVRRRGIELARPRLPVWKSVTGFPGMKFDHVMIERGAVIDSMRYLTDYADECVPVLIEAIDSFEEYDPDMSYGGPVARVASALRRFGPAAAAAAVPLAKKLTLGDGELSTAILDALAAMGPAACGALKLLDVFRKQNEGDEPLPDQTRSRPNRSSDPVGWTIRVIQRRGG